MIRQTTTAALLALFSLGTAQAQLADLTLSKSASPDPVDAGAEVTYTLTVGNAGPDPAVLVTVGDPLPQGSTFVAASSECVYDPTWHRVDCALPLLPPAASMDLTVVVEAAVPAAGTTQGVYLSGETSAGMSPALFALETFQADRRTVTNGDLLLTPRGVAALPDGAMVVADQHYPSPLDDGGAPLFDGALVRVERVSGAQTVLSAGGLMVNPSGVVVGPDGFLYVADPDAVADEDRGRVLRVDPASGAQTVVSELGLLVRPTALAVEPVGTLLVADAIGRLLRVAPDTGVQALVSEGELLMGAEGVAVEAGGTAVVAVPWAGIVRVDLATGSQSLLVAANFSDVVRPTEIEVAANGDLYTADPFAWELGAILRFDPVSGAMLMGFLADPSSGYSHPYGLELVDMVVNHALAESETPDPDSNNNRAWAGIEVVEGGPPPPVEIVVNETVAVSDLVVAWPAIVIAVNESVNVTDQPVVLPAVVIAVAESVAVVDAVAAGPLPPLVITVSESITVSDLPGVLPAVVVSVAENVAVTDQVVSRPAVVITVSEVVNVTDVPRILPAVVIAISESVAVSDQVRSLPAVVIAVAESVMVTDSVEVTVLDGVPPTVLWVHTVADTGDGQLEAGETTATAITQLLVIFSEEVADPEGDLEADDVTNPANFLLLADGGDGVFDTLSCEAGWSPDDAPVAVGPVTYLANLDAAAVRIPGGPLAAGRYRLHVCGSTSITDLSGERLDGNGDGTGGDDFVLPFEVRVNQLLNNPNLDDGLSGWTVIDPAGVQVTHGSADADGATTSGSAQVRNLGAAVVAGLSQCVPVEGRVWHRFGAELGMFSDGATLPAPQLSVSWYPDGACEEPQMATWQALPDPDGLNVWRELSHPVLPAAGSASARVHLLVEAEIAEDYMAFWDDVTFFADPLVIFADGFESGGPAAWTSSTP